MYSEWSRNPRKSVKSFHTTLAVLLQLPFNPPMWENGVGSSAVKAMSSQDKRDGTAVVMGHDPAS